MSYKISLGCPTSEAPIYYINFVCRILNEYRNRRTEELDTTIKHELLKYNGAYVRVYTDSDQYDVVDFLEFQSEEDAIIFKLTFS